MIPVLFQFEIGGKDFSFNSYGLMIGLAFLLWAYLVKRESLRLGLKKMAAGTTFSLICLVASMFIGGKGLYALTVMGDKDAHIDLATGFVFWGAILAATPAMIWRLKSLNVPVLKGLDIFATATPIAHTLGRLGCFCAGCCYGHRSDMAWATTFDHGVGLNGVPLHPVQLYEAGLLVLLWLVLEFYLRPRKQADGELLFAYFGGYSLVRCVTELFRGDPGRRFVFGGAGLNAGDAPSGISTSVFISLGMAFIGFLGFYLVRRRARSH